MAHKSRGTISHTYDINQVTNVDYEQLSITYTDTAHAEPQTATLRVKRHTPAARQLLHAIVNSLAVHGDGQWESAVSLRYSVSRAAVLVERLADQGVTDLSSADVGLAELRAAIETFDPSLKRTFNKLIARALRTDHPNGSALGRALQNTTYMTKESRAELYDDTEADALRRSAQGVFHDSFKAQRSIIAELGYDTAARAWLRIPAEEIVAAARIRHPELEGAPQPRLSAPRIQQIDWALLNPQNFGVAAGRPATRGASIAEIGTALYPPAHVFTAAMILHCLAELSGLNQSVMLRTTPDDLIYTGESNGLLQLAKARNHTEDSVPVRTGTITSLGGLVEALTGMTRFARLFRAQHLIRGDATPEVVNRLYVEHKRDPLKSEIITNQRLHYGWRHSAFDAHWPDTGLDRDKVGLRFTALRRKALEQATGLAPGADVHGHTNRTRIHYLANVLPEHTLVTAAGAAQDQMIDDALAKFAPVTHASGAAAQRLSGALAADKTADLIASTCVSGGNDPDDRAQPCSLGLAACFTCPNGYRTVDHIPGLLATIAFTELIELNDPDEWVNGDAASLHFYATESLKAFPPAAVEQVRATADLSSQIITIHSLYTELRR
jgi:hypothetical protein